MPTDQDNPRIDPELLDVRGVAVLLGIGETLAKQLDRNGELGPQAVRLGKRRLWRRRELVRWIDAGLPRREVWTESPARHTADQHGAPVRLANTG